MEFTSYQGNAALRELREATGFYGSAPIVAIKYTGSKIYAVTVTSEKEITPSIGMWLISDYVVDVSTNMKPVTT